MRCLLYTILATSVASAQDQFRTFAPEKDVAMLVDVSVSVRADKNGHADAKKIIQDIVSGRGFSNRKLVEHWEMEPNPEMAVLFGSYLGQVASSGSAELRPLLGNNGNFFTLRIGNVTTVLTGGITKKFTTEGTSIDALVDSTYPLTSAMNDKSTCFWLAMARSADTLSQKSKLGYYLFVVSDEEDDPDYRKDGPPGHTFSDYETYISELAKTYPEAAIRGEIGRYFDSTGLNSRKVETYKTRGDFKQVLIARFFQNSRSNKKVSMSWYAMGVIPQRVLIPRVLQPKTPQPLVFEPLKYEPPDFKKTAAVQWLGGIGEVSRKSYDYAGPLLVWQVSHAEAAGFEADERPQLQTGSRTLRSKKMVSTRLDNQTWALPTDLEGNHDITLRHGSLEADASITIQEKSYFWLNALAIISAVGAVLVFVLAWRSLRESRTRPVTA